MRDEEGGIVPADLDADAVYGADAYASAPDGLAHEGDLLAGVGAHDDPDRVGVSARIVPRLDERELESRLAGEREGVPHARVIWREPQHACHQGAIAAVAPVGVREGVVEREFDVPEALWCQRAGHEGDAQGSCGMGGRRSHHDGAEYLEGGRRHHGCALLGFGWRARLAARRAFSSHAS